MVFVVLGDTPPKGPEAVKAGVRLVSRLLDPDVANSGDHTVLSGPDALWLSSWRETSNTLHLLRELLNGISKSGLAPV